MFFTDVFFIAVALAMDAFALTIANCTVYNNLDKKSEWAMPTAFGLFQFLMPVIGFYLGKTFSDSVAPAAGFLTSAVFFILGVKIVYDNIKNHYSEEEISTLDKDNTAKFTLKILLIQAVATSIDAFFIGASSFAFNLTSPFICALIVGAITFSIVACALFVGKTLGKTLGKYAEWTGAVILFVLSIKEFIMALI